MSAALTLRVSCCVSINSASTPPSRRPIACCRNAKHNSSNVIPPVTVIAFVVGFAVIAWLLRWVAKHTVYAFVWYRLALGVLLFVALGAGWVSAT